jgi:glycosyltransferase involved in cell wall biosynthesis
MRIAVLWTCLSGYLNACLKELASREGVELFVCHQQPEEAAPFNDDQFSWIPKSLKWRSRSDLLPLDAQLHAFNPEILVICGWPVPAYRHAARKMANRCWRVMTMDNCWMATLKQRMGTLIAPWYIQPLADAVWIPGERQANFARRLGFEERNILWGLLSCDQPVFQAVYFKRLADGHSVPRSFIFVGRFVAEKNLNLLVEAYRVYRESSIDPWPLVCCGAGPLANLLEGRPGIRVEGFVQPAQLPDKLASAGCLVLPSSFEPWALAVHEAAAAGLLILATEKVGATVHLVQDNYNGYIFGSRDLNGLAERMSHISNLNDARLEAMSQASHSLSKQFSPARWADTLIESFQTTSLP